jgi:SAM-dependent methyltransferase
MLDRATAVWAVARAGNPTARLRVLRDGTAALRASILTAGITSGVLPALTEQAHDVPALGRRVGAKDEVLLDGFLDVLAAAGYCQQRAGRWRATRRARAVLDDPVARAAAVAYGGYYTDLYWRLPDQMRGGPARTDIADHADTIAAVSGALQPLVDHLIRTTVQQTRPGRVLDIGCGTGDQLALMLTTAGPTTAGLGVESAPSVARTAAQRLANDGLDSRASVLAMDATELSGRIDEYGGPVDLMLLANVIYYLPTAEQPAFLAGLRPLLRPGGTLLIITTVATDDLFARHFDLLLRAQGRGIAVPTLAGLTAVVRDAGYATTTTQKAVPGAPFIAVQALRPTSPAT